MYTLNLTAEQYTIIWVGLVESSYVAENRDELRRINSLLDRFESFGTRQDKVFVSNGHSVRLTKDDHALAKKLLDNMRWRGSAGRTVLPALEAFENGILDPQSN